MLTLPDIRESTFRSRTVRRKKAICHPEYLQEIKRLQRSPNREWRDDDEGLFYQGVPVSISTNCPKDKIYIVDDGSYEEPIFDPPTIMQYVDEYHHTGPLEQLHVEVEEVCRLAR